MDREDREDRKAAETSAVISVAIARGWMEGFLTKGNTYTVRFRDGVFLVGLGPDVALQERRLTPRDALDWIARTPPGLPICGDE